ncbi:hypothetical protein BGX27_000736 [Mortierella sp. AM989]|nr:hypothetical protein BGX27_000736 [Mortierella sp. AM989]
MAVPPTTQPSNPSAATSNVVPRSSITLVFDKGGSTCLLRPNAIVRGQVELKLIKPCYAAGIRVKLRAEESAVVLGQESNGDSLRQKFHQTVITLFDTEVMVSGSNQNDNELANWQEIVPGTYTYPFALKVPNVNFPPCIPGLDGFSIRYVWTAHVDGPFEASLSSEEVLCQFMPNVLAPKPMEWTYHDTVGCVVPKNSTHQLQKAVSGIALNIKMHQQIYVPGDPLSMVTTLVNNTQNKIVGIDVILRRTVKGLFSTSYANLSNQAQVEIMAQSVECKVRPGETGQVDILTTIPPMGKSYSIPTFESNFLKIYYELLCVVRIKRSVFSGGDTSYHCAIPIPIATHNIDNPIITGRTPRWTKSRLQPYFFEPNWLDPVGDLPTSVANEIALPSIIPGTTVVASPEAPSSVSTPAAGVATSLLSSPGTSSTAMQEFLNSGSAELHRERTLKKSLTRSKSLKDIQSSRLNGSSWRTERDQLMNQGREIGSSHLNRSTTDISQPGLTQTGTNKRSPPLAPKSRPSNDDKQVVPGAAVVDSNGDVAYTPPPPSSPPLNTRPPKSANRDLTPEQQAELARKASRRILPNQGSYTNEGTLPPDFTSGEISYQVQSSTSYGANNNNSSGDGNNSSSVTHPVPPSSRAPPRRNASLSQKTYQQQNVSNGSSSGNFIADQEANAQYDPSYSSRGRSNNSSSDQGYNRSGQEQSQQSGYSSYTNTAAERVPYQHSLPAHQQPPGVVSPVSIAASLPISSGTTFALSPQSERSPSRKDILTTSGLNEEASWNPKQSVSVSGASGNGNGNGNAAMTKIPPWERVERVHHQDWFRPAPHQTGALQTFDVAGISPSQQQVVPVMKKTLLRPIDSVQSIEVEDNLQ